MPKLHLPGPAGLATACNRQLNNNRVGRAQTASNVVLAATADEYFQALRLGRACRHCGREAGLITRVTRVIRDEQDEDADSED